ncbi:hypothetical protein Pmani_026026 [Petrolisthes manimaculis]|uniref:Uncharacterized protein n=1 Tax=Petrolisthes manimaculis TaxID=1843537 RepID=A0AAE1TY93_9EUCA|nr:hypothetical protein Pmani_026026 [Petrolisthes manimaculis]
MGKSKGKGRGQRNSSYNNQTRQPNSSHGDNQNSNHHQEESYLSNGALSTNTREEANGETYNKESTGGMGMAYEDANTGARSKYEGKGKSHENQHINGNHSGIPANDMRTYDQYNQQQTFESQHENRYNYNNQNRSHQRHDNQQNLWTDFTRELICAVCEQVYSSDKGKVPRFLYCKHRMCTSCIEKRRTRDHKVLCGECTKVTFNVLNINNKCPVDHEILNHLKQYTEQVEPVKEKPDSQQSFSIGQEDSSENVHTPTATKNSQQNNKQKGSSKPSDTQQKLPLKSPHNSQCIDKGVRPTQYCINCKQWVCKKCADIDHTKKGTCALASLKDALSDMKNQNKANAESTSDLLTTMLRELEDFDPQIEESLMIMRTAFELIGKKQELVKKSLQDGRRVKEELETEASKYFETVNLPEALAVFKAVDDKVTSAEQWVANETTRIGNPLKIEGCTKAMFSVVCELLRTVEIENGTQSQLYVFEDLPTGKILSEVKVEGGRIHIKSLMPIKTIQEGSRMIPLRCVTSCMNRSSTLTFLDLSWGGSKRGRVYVRLTGDTVRGRQFVRLCTGETNSCFRGTHFHRIWWKNMPGEHIWAGDYENGDGSGGQTVSNTQGRQTPTLIGRLSPITEGLVAGRYEKDNISSIFRIYTKGDKDKNVMEEAAFGQVEFGLDIIKEATTLKDITDVNIEECGIVLEV